MMHHWLIRYKITKKRCVKQKIMEKVFVFRTILVISQLKTINSNKKYI